MCGHILVAVMDFLGMSSDDDTPSLTSPDIWMLRDEERTSRLKGVAAQGVDKHVDLSVQLSKDESTKAKASNSNSVFLCKTLNYPEYATMPVDVFSCMLPTC